MAGNDKIGHRSFIGDVTTKGGTFDSLELGLENKHFNARVGFYNTLRSLDVMQEITKCNFSDHPAVSQELVKFLSMNTSVEAVDVLTKK